MDYPKGQSSRTHITPDFKTIKQTSVAAYACKSNTEEAESEGPGLQSKTLS
jgi:hypothetical protein